MNFLYLNSKSMGNGPEALGEKLLLSFLKNLADSTHHVDFVGCVNSAVELTTQQGDALEQLRAMEAKGAKIVSCGTCLDHFDRRDDLLIGSVGTMPDTVEIMMTADRVIRPC